MAKLHARDAAKRLGITIGHLYSLAGQGRIIGAEPASEHFQRKFKPKTGAAPSFMFDEKALAIKEVPLGAPRTYPVEQHVRVLARVTELQELRWQIAAAKTSEKLKLTGGSTLTIGRWAARALDGEADKVGVPTDPTALYAIAVDLGITARK